MLLGVLCMQCERVEWANRVLFKSHSKEPLSAADSHSVTGFSVGELQTKPQTNNWKVFNLPLFSELEW